MCKIFEEITLLNPFLVTDILLIKVSVRQFFSSDPQEVMHFKEEQGLLCVWVTVKGVTYRNCITTKILIKWCPTATELKWLTDDLHVFRNTTVLSDDHCKQLLLKH